MFCFSDIDRFCYEKTSWIQTLLRICIFIITDVTLDEDDLLDADKISNISDKTVVF